MSTRTGWAILAMIVATAAALRLVDLGSSPPGIHLDAAANAWSARCLLETGRDATGSPWPLVQYRAYGESRSTLYLYALLPFQKAAGMSTVTTALPTALGGILAVLGLYAVGCRLFGRAVGLIAAGLIALAPWPIFLSRTGQEAGLVPILVIGPIAAMLWAGLPLGAQPSRPIPWRAGLAGTLAGIACYGFLAVRIALPFFLVLAVVACGRNWRTLLEERRGRLAALAFALGLGVTLGPLVWAHITDPMLLERAKAVPLWQPTDTVPVKAFRALSRYVEHFGPDFLFVRGDPYYWNWVPGTAPLPWIVAPLLVAGIGCAVAEARSSSAARVALAWLAAYPVADSFAAHPGLHALRSAPGIGGLALLAALGAVRVGAWLRSRHRFLAVSAAGVFAVALAASTARFVHAYVVGYSRGATSYVAYNRDLLDACAWLRPRWADYDAVFVTGRHPSTAGQGYAVVAFGLDYDPNRWFAEERRVRSFEGREFCVGFGKIHFLMGDEGSRMKDTLLGNGRPDRVVYVLRPDEASIPQPTHVIRAPDGRPVLVMHETIL